MTVEDLIHGIQGLPLWIVLVVFLAPVVIVPLLGLLHRDGYGGEGGWRFVYSFLVYWVSLPGIFAAVLVAYSLFFIRGNLLHVSIVVYFLPIASMIATLVLIRKKVEWDDLPGVERLFAFMVLIAVSMAAALIIFKMRFWVFFSGSIFMLLILAAVIYLVLKAAFRKVSSGGSSGPGGRVSEKLRASERRRRKAEADLRRMKKRRKMG